MPSFSYITHINPSSFPMVVSSPPHFYYSTHWSVFKYTSPPSLTSTTIGLSFDVSYTSSTPILSITSYHSNLLLVTPSSLLLLDNLLLPFKSFYYDFSDVKKVVAGSSCLCFLYSDSVFLFDFYYSYVHQEKYEDVTVLVGTDGLVGGSHSSFLLINSSVTKKVSFIDGIFKEDKKEDKKDDKKEDRKEDKKEDKKDDKKDDRKDDKYGKSLPPFSLPSLHPLTSNTGEYVSGRLLRVDGVDHVVLDDGISKKGLYKLPSSSHTSSRSILVEGSHYQFFREEAVIVGIDRTGYTVEKEGRRYKYFYTWREPVLAENSQVLIEERNNLPHPSPLSASPTSNNLKYSIIENPPSLKILKEKGLVKYVIPTPGVVHTLLQSGDYLVCSTHSSILVIKNGEVMKRVESDNNIMVVWGKNVVCSRGGLVSIFNKDLEILKVFQFYERIIDMNGGPVDEGDRLLLLTANGRVLEIKED